MERFLPKEEWGPGPWQAEPDEDRFEHAGHPCILKRSPFTGAWCGYVAVAPGHPWHRTRNQEIEAEVHGGLTYADECQGSICHVPKPGEPADVWWLGFDCGHGFDVLPAMDARMRKIAPKGERPALFEHEVYRTIDYVREQTERLAEQAAQVALEGFSGPR